MAVSEYAQKLINSGFNCEDTMEAISVISREMLAKQLQVDAAEESLKQFKQEYETLNSYVLPSLMAKVQMADFTLEDGTKLKCVEQVFCSLPKTDENARNRALNWLNEQGAGGIIKDNLIVENPSGELITALTGKFAIERKRDVHPSSLKSFISELLGVKQGSVAKFDPHELPSELSVYVKPVTKVTVPKE